MKKLVKWLLISTLTLGVASVVCAGETEESKRVYGGKEQLADLKNHTDEIKELTYQLFGEGGEERYDATEHIEEVVDILSNLEIGKEVFTEACDCDEFFNFIFEDGTELVFWFNGENFRAKNADADGYTTYEVSGFEKFHIRDFGTEIVDPEE